jgi:hypothetical protein
MKAYFLVLTVTLSSLLAACDQSHDDEWRQALVGTWQGIEADSTGVVIIGETTYIPGGRLNVRGRIKFEGDERQILASGTWEVKQGYLHYILESSNISDINSERIRLSRQNRKRHRQRIYLRVQQ